MSENTSQLIDWYRGHEGIYVLGEIELRIQDKLSEIFGYYAVEMGLHTEICSLLQQSRIKNNIKVFMPDTKHDAEGIIAAPEFLPIVFDNIDLLIASHVFEDSDYPHQVLREIDRILVPEGHCLLLGFNPYSYLGLMKSLRLSKFSQHKQTFRSAGKMKDWLQVLGYEVISIDSFGFRPSIERKKLFDSLSWLETLGKRFFSKLGGVYLIHAKKTEFAYPPVTSWKTKKILSGKSAIPAASKEGNSL